MKNPFRYRGYVWDAETELYYLGSRYYDAEVGRFLNADSIIVGIGNSVRGANLYIYCWNNSINLYDPSGKIPEWIPVAVGVLWESAKNTVKTYVNLIKAPWKALNVKVGGGVGLGLKTQMNIKGVTTDVQAVASITDSIVYDQGKIDVRTDAGGNIGITPDFGTNTSVDWGYTVGIGHSFSDDRCICEPLTDTFGQRTLCPANEIIQESSSSVGIGFGVYVGIGFECYIGMDMEIWKTEVLNATYDLWAPVYNYFGF